MGPRNVEVNVSSRLLPSPAAVDDEEIGIGGRAACRTPCQVFMAMLTPWPGAVRKARGRAGRARLVRATIDRNGWRRTAGRRPGCRAGGVRPCRAVEGQGVVPAVNDRDQRARRGRRRARRAPDRGSVRSIAGVDRVVVRALGLDHLAEGREGLAREGFGVRARVPAMARASAWGGG